MRVKLEMRSATDPNLLADGDIYPPGSTSTTPPQEADVQVGANSPWEKELPKGTWIYKFVAGAGAGKFQIWALDAVTGAELSHDAFDTAVADIGLALKFTVP